MIPPKLVESELFDHEKATFTVVTDHKHGKLELASQGILFLGKVGDLLMEIPE